MARIPQEIMNTIHAYVRKISRKIPVKKAILFGSYAKGTFNEQSDVDLAIFSNHFAQMTRVEGIQYLLAQAREYEIDLQPIAFDEEEYEERLGMIEEIVQTGVEVSSFAISDHTG